MSVNTPEQLREILLKYDDLDSAARVYHEASSLIKQYTQVKKLAEEAAFSRMPAGELKVKTDSGHNCGYTRPKAKRLDKERWKEHLEENPNVADQIDEAESFIKSEQAPFMVMGDARFYVR